MNWANKAAAFLASSSAIFFMFWQAAESRHYACTLASPRKRGITVTMQFLGIGEAALHRFLASGVKPFAQIGQPIGVDRVLEVFPDVPGDQLLMIPALCALQPLSTAGWIRGVFPIAQAVGRAVR